MRYALLFLCLTLSGLVACSRMVDVIAYEMTIERVKRSDPRIPHYQTKALANSSVERSLKEAGFTSFLWLHPDQSVSEWYANDAARTNAVNVKSVSKALFSALIGVDKTLDLNAPIASFAGCAVPDALQPLSFDTLLNMTAGFTFTENVSSDIYAAPNWGCRAMQLPSEARSGARFNYNTLQYHLAGLALAEYRGVDVATLFQNEVLDAMEIQLDGWIKNSDGDVFTGSEMRLHPKDMLRFGEVYLNDGRFNGKHIIPKS